MKTEWYRHEETDTLPCLRVRQGMGFTDLWYNQTDSPASLTTAFHGLGFEGRPDERSDTMILKLSLDLPEDVTYVRTTRLLSRCLLEDIGVTRTTIGDVETIVSELCSNVVRHAHSQSAHYLMTLEYYKPRVVITVMDVGHGFVQGDVAPVGTSRPDGNGGERLGGWGLTLLEGVSDRLDFTVTDPHGTTVRVEKNLHYETQGDADEAAERDKDSGGGVMATKE